MTTANKVTILRILLVPFFVVEVLYYMKTGIEAHRIAAISAFVIAAGCDGVDGFIARRFNQRSELGAMLDPNFFLIAAKPDNVPIVAMIFLLGFFTWLALRKAYLNDTQLVVGGIPWEKTESDEKLFTWPDLVYTELLCMILLTIVMIVWSVVLRAPLEEAANPTSSPNPAKAPWYFLGLQELLTMFHPMVAGVTIPGLGLIGLGAAGYIDKNPSNKPEDRKFAYALFTIFMMFWAVLVILGSFFRGEGFNFILPWRQGVHEIFDL